jgi:hypothetical protein
MRHHSLGLIARFSCVGRQSRDGDKLAQFASRCRLSCAARSVSTRTTALQRPAGWETEEMPLFRLRKGKNPSPKSYQERFRAIGRQIDQDRLRFRILIETADGFFLKAEELSLHPQGDSGTSWISHTFWLKDGDIQEIVDDAHDGRGEDQS